MSEDLKQLIYNLERGREEKDSYFQYIRYPDLFLEALHELKDVIGNEKIKKAIAEQIPYYIFTRQQVEKGKIKEDEVMMNTVIFGKPGVGKTLIGKKLAKIWFALGCVKNNAKPETNKDFLKKIFNNNQENESLLTVNNLMVFVPLIVYLIIIISLIWSVFQKIGFFWFMLIIILIIFLLICFIYYFNEEEKIDKKNNDDKNVNKNVQTTYFEDDIVQVVSRPDFVDKYVGWSEQKTLKLLNQSLGKVLVIDEAYSLASGMDDSYGIEVLNTLNLFLSEHPNEIIVIFIGYKDLLEKGIFSYQPGLKRRTMFKFYCDGYNTEELLQIFIFHLERSGWHITEKDEITKLFYKYRDVFVDQAGDVQRLIHFCKIPASKDYMRNRDLLENTLYARHIAEGIMSLKDNMINSDEDEENNKEKETMEKLRKFFQNRPCQKA
jgi:SpoVK/Ycf46/Vps4 family AAA+-type ATPase